jgi:hypothetical protein
MKARQHDYKNGVRRRIKKKGVRDYQSWSNIYRLGGIETPPSEFVFPGRKKASLSNRVKVCD